MNRVDVERMFDRLADDAAGFFQQVADDVDWTVMGTHPLAGRYRDKQAFLDHTFAKLSQVLPEDTRMGVESVMVDGDWAMVELRTDATAKNGMRFDNRYCWVCRFDADRIVEVRTYLDSAMVARLFRENPIAWWEPRSDRPSSSVVD